MAKASPSLLLVMMILICAGWVSLWLLKPTDLWTRKWHGAEEAATSTVFGYNVYSFPAIAVAITGLIYMQLKPKEKGSRHGRSSNAVLSNPLVVNSYIGVLSGMEILVVSLFILFLAWTFYARISNDYKRMLPVKTFKLHKWQYKIFRMATRCGLLSEACLALLLFPISRGMAIFRLLGIQFEASVRYHIWLGTSMVFFATLHGTGTFYIWGIKHRIPEEIWKWQKTGRIYLAGEVSLVTLIVIWITSLPQIRRRQFEIFYYTHHLYIVFFVFFLFHTGDRHFYMVFPGTFLFALEKLLRIVQSKPESCILSAQVLPCKAVELILPKNPRLKYTPTSIIFVKIPSISKFQWHSFSITSSSRVDDNTMSVLIKCAGWWTSSLLDILHAELDSNADQSKCIPIAIEGPYGPRSLNFLRYDSLLLVAGGIGITPFLSILQEIASAENSGRRKLPSSIQLIYSVKKCEDICLLSAILPLLLDRKFEQLQLKLKVFVTQEVRYGATVRELFSEFPQAQTIEFDTKCSRYATYGPDSLHWMAAIVGFSSIVFFAFLSCFNYLFLRRTQKAPSSVTDFLLICAFAISIMCSILVAVILRWRSLRKELPPVYEKHGKAMKQSSTEANRAIEEHEVYFGGRPNFQEIFSKFPDETGGSYIGVLVCGPDTMKESVAASCQLNSLSFKNGIRKRDHFLREFLVNYKYGEP
ncbi:hypothetical protein RJ639_030340 [Escallonia herrerae]|uniref:FAD-binding FR-type domain-containing protein n=1 Tax=Escallonia herrerae TaxID=1293975 RepID=A0AA89BIA1_9ASTE|nr:hypothetical protein RJ639_030340 [Escallonia herrerae]